MHVVVFTDPGLNKCDIDEISAFGIALINSRRGWTAAQAFNIKKVQ